MTFLFTLINKTFCKILYYSSDLCKMMVVTYLIFNSFKSGCKKTPKMGYSPCSSVQSSHGCSFIPMLPSSRCPVQLGAMFTMMLQSARCPFHLSATFTPVLPSARCPIQLDAPFTWVPLQLGVLFSSVSRSDRCPLQLHALVSCPVLPPLQPVIWQPHVTL